MLSMLISTFQLLNCDYVRDFLILENAHQGIQSKVLRICNCQMVQGKKKSGKCQIRTSCVSLFISHSRGIKQRRGGSEEPSHSCSGMSGKEAHPHCFWTLGVTWRVSGSSVRETANLLPPQLGSVFPCMPSE